MNFKTIRVKFHPLYKYSDIYYYSDTEHLKTFSPNVILPEPYVKSECTQALQSDGAN